MCNIFVYFVLISSVLPPFYLYSGLIYTRSNHMYMYALTYRSLEILARLSKEQHKFWRFRFRLRWSVNVTLIHLIILYLHRRCVTQSVASYIRQHLSAIIATVLIIFCLKVFDSAFLTPQHMKHMKSPAQTAIHNICKWPTTGVKLNLFMPFVWVPLYKHVAGCYVYSLALASYGFNLQLLSFLNS